ncbi:hypothetical protein OEZ85_004130 [Tetradesmus obliquus]|uniref:Phosphatidylglycerol lysyltransferase C-terminal domain-containing protein n=1 Tax=Tetradesmus obliquus TaxID=3088 RepID=A0ABY8UGH1_TETOB|nr:hypothetical protein OEZ85_004130 [Tetradesmus obliquus]
MIRILAILLIPAGLVLCLIHLLVVVYAVLLRAARCLTQQVTRRVCGRGQGRATAEENGVPEVVRSVKMQGLQIEAAGCILVRDEPTSLQQQEVLRLFEAHGSANANCYTAFSNPEIQVFLAPNRGCMLYTVAQHWAHTIVCATGDPLCEPQHTLSMLQLFKAAFPDAIFIDLSKAAAQLLAAEGGVTITDLGCETTIDVQQFHFEFNKKTKHIRRRAEVAAKAGLVVEEVGGGSSAALRDDLRQMAREWQQGKACSDDIKVFSRALPWEAVGQEKGVRVFIARALAPGEAPPATPAAAAKLLVGKGPKQQQQQEELSAAAVQQQGAGQLSRKQRKLRERAARIRALQEAAGGNAAAAAAAGDAAGDALDSPQQSEDASRDILVIIADQDTNKQQQQDEKQQRGSQAAAGFKSDKPAALASDEVVLELAPFKVGKGPSWTAESNSSSTGISSASTDAAAPPAAGPIPRIHACIVLDPVYSSGRVIGYTAERSFLHPRGVKGAVKLLQRHTLALLRAEGYSLLNLGLAVGYEVKPGVHHGFRDCAWLTTSLQLCYKYANSLYAFHNLAHTKACWGGGYAADSDSYKFAEAVHLVRKYAALPAAWSCPVGDGPFNAGVCFRHFGLYGDPWELLLFWRYMAGSSQAAATTCDNE